MTAEPDVCCRCKMQVDRVRQVRVTWRGRERVACLACATTMPWQKIHAEDRGRVHRVALHAHAPSIRMGLTPRRFIRDLTDGDAARIRREEAATAEMVGENKTR